MSVCVTVHLSVWLSGCLAVCLSVCLFVCLSNRVSCVRACLPVNLPACLPAGRTSLTIEQGLRELGVGTLFSPTERAESAKNLGFPPPLGRRP